MKARIGYRLGIVAFAAALALAVGKSQAADGLPSWRDGPAKQSIVAFVERVTAHGSADLVPVTERIAVFDNDGTSVDGKSLWHTARAGRRQQRQDQLRDARWQADDHAFA